MFSLILIQVFPNVKVYCVFVDTLFFLQSLKIFAVCNNWHPLLWLWKDWWHLNFYKQRGGHLLLLKNQLHHKPLKCFHMLWVFLVFRQKDCKLHLKRKTVIQKKEKCFKERPKQHSPHENKSQASCKEKHLPRLACFFTGCLEREKKVNTSRSWDC